MLFLDVPLLLSAALLWPTGSSAASSNFTGTDRPFPLDSEDGYRYNRVGSYFHGDLKLELQIANNTGTEFELYNGTVCEGFRTIQVKYQKSTVFLGRPAVTRHPIAVAVNGVIDDRRYDNESSVTNGFWDEAAFRLSSDESESNSWDITAEPWNEEEKRYDFMSRLVAESWNTIAFNLTITCASNGTSPDDNDDSKGGDPYSFTGHVLNPDNDDVQGWDSKIPTPQLNGSFNDREANINFTSAFKLNNGYSRKEATVLFGFMNVSFDGKVDTKQSDDLILDKEEPEWNATVGLEDPKKEDEEDDGHQTMVNLVLAYGFAVLAAGMLYA